MLMRTAITALALATMTACTTLPKAPESREAWEAIHTRSFDATPDQLSKAAEDVLRLADGEFAFDYPQNQLHATRRWTVYMVLAAAMGTDYWHLDFSPQPDGKTLATVRISRAESAIMPTPTVYGDTAVTTQGMPGKPVYGPALYRLFWERVEYKLGLRDEWQTCDQFKVGLSSSDRTSLNPLCSINTDDRSP